MPWIDEAETEVLSPVGLEWLADQKGRVYWVTCVLWFQI